MRTGKRRSYCATCQVAYLRAYRESRPEPDRTEYFKQYYRDHKAEYVERSRQWRKVNPERWVSYSASWAKRFPAKAANNAAARRARVAENGSWLVTSRDLDRLCQRSGGKCSYCKIGPIEHIDHIIPISRGGRHSIGNLAPACKPCNMDKFTKLLVEWRVRRG